MSFALEATAAPPSPPDPGVTRPPSGGLTLAPGRFDADLAVELRIDKLAPVIGTRIVMEITVTNHGPRRDRRVVVSGALPSALLHDGHSEPGGYDPDSARWSVGVLEPGESRTAVVPLKAVAGGQFAPMVSVSGETTDPEPANNAAGLTLSIRTPPNVIVIMLDDLDVRSLEDMLNANLLPALATHVVDRGVKFSESFVTNPICCPSRATFLTGRYSHNHGVLANIMNYPDQGALNAVGFLDDSDTLATRLQAIGYTTGYFGKYLNGYGERPAMAHVAPAFDPTYVPPGWDTWAGLIDPSTYCMYNYAMNQDGVVVTYGLAPGTTESSARYQTHLLATLAGAFVAEHKDDLQPFFLAVMPLAPHTEVCSGAYPGGRPPSEFHMTVRPAPEDKLVETPPFVPSLAYDEDTSDKPAWLAGLPPLSAEEFDAIAAQYQGRLRSLVAVDRLLAHLVDSLGPALADTVIMFTSDNGWNYGERRLSGKRVAYDEAARVPLYVRPVPAVASVTRPSLVTNNDLAPTILHLADPDFPAGDFDGRSFVPLLGPTAPGDWTERRRFLIEHCKISPQDTPGVASYKAIRMPHVLYIESSGRTLVGSGVDELSGLEWYDLHADPAQLMSIIRYPDSQRDTVMAQWIEQLQACAGVTCQDLETQPD